MSSRPAFGSMYSPRSMSSSWRRAYFFAWSRSWNALVDSLPSGPIHTASHRLAFLDPPRSGCRAVFCRIFRLPVGSSGSLTSENHRSLTLAMVVLGFPRGDDFVGVLQPPLIEHDLQVLFLDDRDVFA